MAERAEQSTDQLLCLLLDAGVEFIVVGGVAAISHGAATMTRDLDVVARMSESNLSRLMEALAPQPCAGGSYGGG